MHLQSNPHIITVEKALRCIINSGAGESSLWARVILQAIQDAYNHANSNASQHYQAQTRMWLMKGSRDLEMACDLAGIDMSWLVQHMSRAFDVAANDYRTPVHIMEVKDTCDAIVMRMRSMKPQRDYHDMPLFSWVGACSQDVLHHVR